MSETLGLMLVRANKITRAQLYEALREQRKNPGSRLGDILFARGWIGEDDVALLISKQLGLEFIDSLLLSKLPVGIAEKLPMKVAEEYRVVPVKLAKGRLTIAMEDQRTRNYLDELSYLVGTTCIPALASPAAVRAALKRIYGIESDAPVPDPDDTLETRPARALERPPTATVDARGRAGATVKKADGQEKVYLLTEVAPPKAAAPVGDGDGPTVLVARSKKAAPTSPRQEDTPTDDEPEEKTRLLPRSKPATAAPSAEPVLLQAKDEERHDNFLAPDEEDDRPMFTPKKVGPASVAEDADTQRAAPVETPRADAGGDFDIIRAAERLFECTAPEQIAEIIVRFARNLVDKAMLFDLSGERFRCISTTPGMEEENLGREFPPEGLVLLGVIAQNKQPAFGPTPNGEMYDRFFDLLGLVRPPVILLYPLTVGGITKAVLYGGLAQPRPADEFGDLQLLFKEAGTAWEILTG